jgi:hypothetical protein
LFVTEFYSRALWNPIPNPPNKSWYKNRKWPRKDYNFRFASRCRTAKQEVDMSESGSPVKLEGAALAAAILILAVWLGLLAWMAFHTGATEVEWARLFSVLGSLEAVTFAAAGALFGTTIQKQRVQDARERADKAEGRASDAEKTAASKTQAAANGQALATAVKARAAQQPRSVDRIERVSTTAAPAAMPDDLVALADKLFPD